MKNLIAGNIARYRKEQGLTQEELGKQLGITFQAVSKWETEQAMPDITLLPDLAALLRISVDKLLGYDAPKTEMSFHDAEYSKEAYYGGVSPSPECLKVISLLPPDKPLKVLDIGCGEGKNAVFFARCGYEVSATDLSEAGIEKTKRLADKARVHVHAFRSDIWDYRLDCKYDIIFCNRVFQYIKPELREEVLNDYRKNTNPGGVHAINTLVAKPFIDDPSESDGYTHFWRSGQLLMYYHDWLIEDFSEYILNCETGCQHAVNQLYARRK